jgi:hypothetical protein
VTQPRGLRRGRSGSTNAHKCFRVRTLTIVCVVVSSRRYQAVRSPLLTAFSRWAKPLSDVGFFQQIVAASKNIESDDALDRSLAELSGGGASTSGGGLVRCTTERP